MLKRLKMSGTCRRQSTKYNKLAGVEVGLMGLLPNPQGGRASYSRRVLERVPFVLFGGP